MAIPAGEEASVYALSSLESELGGFSSAVKKTVEVCSKDGVPEIQPSGFTPIQLHGMASLGLVCNAAGTTTALLTLSRSGRVAWRDRDQQHLSISVLLFDLLTLYFQCLPSLRVIGGNGEKLGG